MSIINHCSLIFFSSIKQLIINTKINQYIIGVPINYLSVPQNKNWNSLLSVCPSVCWSKPLNQKWLDKLRLIVYSLVNNVYFFTLMQNKYLVINHVFLSLNIETFKLPIIVEL